jgi:(2Fe-2S) ferredoxin
MSTAWVLLSLPPSWVQIFSSTLRSETPSVSVLPLVRDRIKQIHPVKVQSTTVRPLVRDRIKQIHPVIGAKYYCFTDCFGVCESICVMCTGDSCVLYHEVMPFNYGGIFSRKWTIRNFIKTLLNGVHSVAGGISFCYTFSLMTPVKFSKKGTL